MNEKLQYYSNSLFITQSAICFNSTFTTHATKQFTNLKWFYMFITHLWIVSLNNLEIFVKVYLKLDLIHSKSKCLAFHKICKIIFETKCA